MGNRTPQLSALILLFAATFIGARAADRYRLKQQKEPNWTAVRYDIGEWKGSEASFDPVYGSDPADTNLLRSYKAATGSNIVVYVGFYRNLSAILDVHTPELCYPAQGWRVVSAGNVPVGLFRGMKIPAKEIIADKDRNKRLVMWWYNAGDRPFETRIRYVYAMLAMSTFTGRTDGSMVRLETFVEEGGEAAAAARLNLFRESFLPELEKALPR